MVQSKEKKFRKKKKFKCEYQRIQGKKGSMKPTIEPKKKKDLKKWKMKQGSTSDKEPIKGGKINAAKKKKRKKC